MPPLAPAPAASYWRLSRAPRYSLLFALPLLALYEALAALLATDGGPQVRNGAEAWLIRLSSLVAGSRGGLVVIAVVVVGCVALAGWDMRRHRGRLQPRIFGLMLAESAVLAVLCGVIVGTATAHLLGAAGVRLAVVSEVVQGAAPAVAPSPFGWPTRLMLSLGAGLFEELVFRVMLVGSLAYALRRALHARPAVAGAVAAVVGALVFSFVHYLGPLGDTFSIASFTFRALAGLFFSVLFVTRGFGIAAWTHALYDVMVLL